MSLTPHPAVALQPQSSVVVYVQLALVAMIWGGTFVAGRYLNHELSPLLLATLRFLVAGLALGAMLAFSRRGFVRISRVQALKLFGLGFCGVYAYHLFFFYGLQHINASRASLIVAMNPAMMAIFSYLLFKEKLSATRWLGVVLCLLGTATVLLGGQASVRPAGGALLGDMAILGCVLAWVLFSVCARTTIIEIGPLHTVAYSVLAGAIMLLLTSLAVGAFSEMALRQLSITDIAGLGYLGVIGSALAYVWYYDGIKKVGATRAGVFIALNPLTAVIAGTLLLNEPLSGWVFVGGGLILLGIILTNKK